MVFLIIAKFRLFRKGQGCADDRNVTTFWQDGRVRTHLRIYGLVLAAVICFGSGTVARAVQEKTGYSPPVIAPVLPPRQLDDGGQGPIPVNDPFNEEDLGRTPANMLTAASIQALLDNEESPFWQAARREVEAPVTRRLVSGTPIGRGTVGPRAGRKRIALTFDDGPHTATTLSILRVLKQHRVPATFFFVGTMAERHPDLVRAAFIGGHSIGNHTFHHMTMVSLPETDALTEIKACGNVLRAVTGVTPHLFRPPGGRYNSKIAAGAAALGYRTILWTSDPGDFNRLSSAAIVQRTALTATPGGIVILHSGVPETVRALPEIIKSLRRAGYEFVTVDTLLKPAPDYSRIALSGTSAKPLVPGR